MTHLIELSNKNGESTIEILYEIDAQLEKYLELHCERLTSFQNEAKFADSIIKDYQDYIDCVSDAKSSNEDTLRKVNNYLNAFFTYLSYWEKYMARNKSEEFINFYHTVRREIYGSTFEYRFLYNLRNYASHGGRPYSSIRRSVKKGIILEMDRESFVKEYESMQAPFRKELINRDDQKIDVDNAIRIVHEKLMYFHKRLIDESLDTSKEDYLLSATTILNFNKEHIKNNGYLAIADEKTKEFLKRLQNNFLSETLTYKELPVALAKVIVKGCHIKFKFEGEYKGESPSFPVIDKSNLAIAKPHFFSGSEYAERDGVTFIRIGEQTSWRSENSYDSYFAVYMPTGLTINEYMAEYAKFEEEEKEFLDKRSSVDGGIKKL